MQGALGRHFPTHAQRAPLDQTGFGAGLSAAAAGVRQLDARLRLLAASRFRHISLARQFSLVGFAIVLLAALGTGAWVSRQIEAGVLNRTAAITALYVDSVVSFHAQALASSSTLPETEVAELDRLLHDTPLGQRVVAFKIWRPDGVVVYSPDRRLMGQRFDTDGDSGLERALAGDVTAQFSDLSEAANVYERERWSRLVEVYAPIREDDGGGVIAVNEFYQLPDELEADLSAAQRQSWAVVAAASLAVYLALAGLVKRGSDTIQRQVRQLERLLGENSRLHARVRRAAGRTTALNELALRRISADLHAGPGQMLALALLRLGDGDPLPAGAPAPDRLAQVRAAVEEALAEVRAISDGLRSPELVSRTVAEVAERAVADHTRRSGTRVALQVHAPAETAPLPIKIALLRTLQEALSNATRHGQGLGVAVSVWTCAGRLYLEVADAGPGFDPSRRSTDGQLGLAGIRERAQLLGGQFQISSAPGRGTRLQAWWPLATTGDLL